MHISGGFLGGQSELDNTRWALVAINGNPPIEGHQAIIQFENGQTSRTTDCNSYVGTYQVKGDAISFGPIAKTEMVCIEPEGMMVQEQT